MSSSPPTDSETTSKNAKSYDTTPSSTNYDYDSNQITPVSKHRRKYLSKINATPESPLFTRQDQLNIHKQKADLEMEISTLQQRLKTLQIEAKKVKHNIVSQGELTFLKAETRSQISMVNSTQFSDLMNSFVETVREARAASAICTILEQKIREESAHRTQIINESNEIEATLDFSDLGLEYPQLQVLDTKINNLASQNTERSLSQLRDIQSQLIQLTNQPKSNPLQADAALEIVRAAESQWHLRSVGTIVVRNEIQNLQRYISENDAYIKKLENELSNCWNNLSEIQLKGQKGEASSSSQVEKSFKNNEKELINFDGQINDLIQKIRMTSQKYDYLCEEIQELEQYQGDSSQNTTTDYLEEEEEDSFDEPEIFEFETNPIEARLNQQKSLLLNDIEQLQTELSTTKKKYKHKEEKLKKQIKKLSNKYKSNKRLINDHAAIMNSMNSPLGQNITSLIEKIESSIIDIKSGF